MNADFTDRFCRICHHHANHLWQGLCPDCADHERRLNKLAIAITLLLGVAGFVIWLASLD